MIESVYNNENEELIRPSVHKSLRCQKYSADRKKQ